MRTIECASIQTERTFDQWLLRQEQSSEAISSCQLAEAYFFLLQQIDHGRCVNLDLVRRVQSLYPQGLLSGRPNDPNTVASVIKYVGTRMPTQIFKSNLTSIHFTNSTSEIMNVIHVSRAPGRIKRRKFAPNRSRWYIRNEIDEKKLELTFHVRDVSLQDPTDAFEMLSWLGSLEQARTAVLTMCATGVDIAPIRVAFRDLYEKHLRSEIEMLKKKKVAIFNVEPNLLLSINTRLQELQLRLLNLDVLSANLLQDWLSEERGEILLTQAHPNQKVLGGLESINEPNAAEVTLTLAKEKIDREKLKNPTDILFGNDFSMRIFLSIGLFTDSEFEMLKKTFKSSKEKIQLSLEQLLSQPVREAAEKFFLIQQLSQFTGEDEGVQQLRTRLFSAETFEKIGINRLVATADSPIADPVDLIDFSKIDTTVFNNLPTFLQTILLQLKAMDKTLLSVPYTLGNLAKTTLEAADELFPTLQTENFIGKVGYYANGVEGEASVGDVVVGNQVLSQFETSGVPITNAFQDLLMQYDFPVRTGSLLTTAGLTFQESSEMAELSSDPFVGDLFLEMEADHIRRARTKRKSDKRLKSNHVYYISDKTINPSKFDHKLHGNEKISESLGERGSVPMFICLLAVLENLGRT